MARITIDVTSAFHQTAGIGRLTREIVGALTALSTSHQYRFFCMGRPSTPSARTLLRDFAVAHPTTISRLNDRNFHRLWFKARVPLPVAWMSGGISDVYHATDFVLPPLSRRQKSVLTVHDLTFERDPQSAVPTLLGFLRRVVPRSAHSATHIVADSLATARDLTDLYGIAPGKITTIYCGVSARFQPVGSGALAAQTSELRAKYGLGDGSFVLAVGTLQKRKNHITLVRAFARLSDPGCSLVMAGGKGWLYDEVLREVRALGLEGRVRFPGFVDDADLPALYRAARVFAFPSLYEGFGIPLLEAIACGTPVVTSNVSSLPEVVGDVGFQVSPLDVSALAAALDHAWFDEAWRADQFLRGVARAAQFTWEKSARQLADVYDRVIDDRAVPDGRARPGNAP